jgi:DNA-binding response OmpR family regulator
MNDGSYLPIILLIEDDLATRELYERELGQAFPVQAVALDEKTLSLTHQPSLQLIILGLDAPHKKSWLLLKQLCQPESKEAHAQAPIIVYSTSDDRRHTRNLNIAEFLIQPVLPSLLNEKARQHIAAPKSRPGGLFKFHSKS